MPAAVHAGRPLATEDAGVLERGACEWESFAASTRAQASPDAQTLSSQVGCGVGASTQLALAAARQANAGARIHVVALAGKSGLIEGTPSTPALTLAWVLAGTRTPSGSLWHEQTALNIVVSQPLAGALTGHANLGWTRTRSARQSAATWNLAAEYALANGVDVMAERYGQQHGAPWFGTGLRLAAGAWLVVDASYARQSGSAKARLATLGAKLVF